MKCRKCGEELIIGVGIENTNIAFPVVTDKKMYDNDDRILMTCSNGVCDFYGVVIADIS
jgi:hypothetical protein